MPRADVIDLTTTSCDADRTDPAELARSIIQLADRVDGLWVDLTATGDFVELERLTSASHALHRAAIVLEQGALIGA